jgi:predicted enzyme related to lactoylglutathione lyase
MLRGLDHVYFWTRDMEAAVAFYRDALGLPLLRRDGDAWAEFDAGPVRLAIHGRVDEGQPTPSGGTVVFAVDDLDAARWALERRGVRFHEKVGEVPGLARFATFQDPDGNVLSLIEYARAS